MDVRQLTRRVMCQPVGAAIEIRQHGPAFERCGGSTTVGEATTDDDAGFRESARNIAAGPRISEGNITRHRVVKARCTSSMAASWSATPASFSYVTVTAANASSAACAV